MTTTINEQKEKLRSKLVFLDRSITVIGIDDAVEEIEANATELYDQFEHMVNYSTNPGDTQRFELAGAIVAERRALAVFLQARERVKELRGKYPKK